eukprot:scaffold133060_cov21-Cyclotella_meneghiniana.AAC.1
MEAPPSYARGKKRIDFLLGNDHVQRAETLQKRYEHQNIAKRVNDLATRLENKPHLDETYITAYNDLDDEIVELILSTAKRVGRVDFGYQRSADLCIAGKTIRLHKAILSCIRNDIRYTESIETLANELNHQLPNRDEINVRQAIAN